MTVSNAANILEEKDTMLLTALSEFIRNIVNQQHHLQNASIDTPRSNWTFEKDMRGEKGQQLLASLEGFVLNVVCHLPQCANVSHSSDGKDKGDKVASKTMGVNRTMIQNAPSCSAPGPSLTRQINGYDIPHWAQEDIQWHVYNKLPIRLLTFDSNGTRLKLMERNKIFHHLKAVFFDEMMRPGSQLFKEMEEHIGAGEFLKRHASYAILSHTWIRDIPGDVIYQGWSTRHQNRHGYGKLANFCRVAAQNHGVRLAWMDTVCINKDSSTELDESIRSMYKWYRGARICVVYLAETRHLNGIHNDSWFTRGWTLQELLAPRAIEFYDEKWRTFLYDGDYPELPFPVEAEIGWQVRKATGITPKELNLCREGDIDEIPLSRRMQLAVGRNVTREEDEAYALMGILGVDIPIAYGEGYGRAFFRLMKELLSSEKHVLDIFNYGENFRNSIIPSGVWQYKYRTTLFDNTGNDIPSLLDQWEPLEPIILTHIGVRIPLLLAPGLIRDHNTNSALVFPYGQYFSRALLDCWHSDGAEYDILDARIYTQSNIVNRADNQADNTMFPMVATFGILNFGVDNNFVLLPQHCLSIPLDCGILRFGSTTPSKNVKVIEVDHPIVFQLKSTQTNSEKLKIHREDLQNHGMQILTLSL